MTQIIIGLAVVACVWWVKVLFDRVRTELIIRRRLLATHR
jgi:hypothetical protein